jgi:hypothetical protein
MSERIAAWVIWLAIVLFPAFVVWTASLFVPVGTFGAAAEGAALGIVALAMIVDRR